MATVVTHTNIPREVDHIVMIEALQDRSRARTFFLPRNQIVEDELTVMVRHDWEASTCCFPLSIFEWGVDTVYTTAILFPDCRILSGCEGDVLAEK